MSYTRKQYGKKSKMTRNNRNRNYKKNNKNNKNNKKFGGVVPAVTISTATKAGLFGKKAISAVKVGSKLSKGNLSNLGVGLLDDALLYSGSYLFGKKGKKNKKQKGGDGGAIDVLKTTLKTADKIPGITFIPAYKIFSGIKDKLFDLLDIVQNENIQNILNTKEMPAEEIKKQINTFISNNENIKTEINKYKDVCSNLDKITGLPIIGKQIDKAIPHREELCMAFMEFDETENSTIENTEELNEDVLENDDNSTVENTEEPKENVLDNNDNSTVENTEKPKEDVLENNENSTVDKTENPEKDVLNNNDNSTVENTEKPKEDVLENDEKNCIKTSGFVKTITGADEFCYKNKQQGAGSRKSLRKGSRKSRKSLRKK